jgi:hypothetical protein
MTQLERMAASATGIDSTTAKVVVETLSKVHTHSYSYTHTYRYTCALHNVPVHNAHKVCADRTLC